MLLCILFKSPVHTIKYAIIVYTSTTDITSICMQALELFSLLTVKIVLSQAEANLWQELASQPAQGTEKLQDHLESAYSNGMIMYLLFTSIPFRVGLKCEIVQDIIIQLCTIIPKIQQLYPCYHTLSLHLVTLGSGSGSKKCRDHVCGCRDFRMISSY